jgi:hypothetical protein
MIKLLKLTSDYTVEPNKEGLFLIPEFKGLFTLNYNKAPGDVDGRKRIRAQKEIIYIYFMYDIESEYLNFSEGQRHLESLKAAGLDEDYKISKEMEAAIEKFRAASESREIKMLKSAYKRIDKLIKFWEDQVITNPNHSTAIQKEIQGLAQLMDSLRKVEDQVKKNIKSASKIRGDQEPGYLT